MAFSRGFRGSRGQTRVRRTSSWDGGPNALPITLGAVDKQNWTNGVTLTTETKVTLVRIRGMIEIHVISVSAIGDGFDGAWGIGIVSADAFAAGVASQPGALTDPEWPGWMAHGFFNVRAISATIGDGVNAVAAFVRIPIESKAMRKFGSSEVLMGSMELVENGSASGEFWADCRILAKLS